MYSLRIQLVRCCEKSEVITRPRHESDQVGRRECVVAMCVVADHEREGDARPPIDCFVKEGLVWRITG